MTWNYRVIKTIHGDEIGLDIHEVFYDEDKNPDGWSKLPISVYGTTKEELLQTMEWMTAGINKPFLVEKDNKLIEE